MFAVFSLQCAANLEGTKCFQDFLSHLVFVDFVRYRILAHIVTHTGCMD